MNNEARSTRRVLQVAAAVLWLGVSGMPFATRVTAEPRQTVKIVANASCTASSRTLAVSRTGQAQSNWCWAASAGMIMQYHGTTVSQCQQATDVTGHNCCACAGTSDCNTTGWPHFEWYGFNRSTVNGALSFSALVNEIENDRPIAFSWWWNSGGGHMMVAYGYDLDSDCTARVLVHDPLPVGSGSSAAILYSAYVDGGYYSHAVDYYGIHP